MGIRAAGAVEAEFADFVREASPRLLRTAYWVCGDAHQAQDLVQSALEKVYLRWSRLRGGDPVAYARRCLVNEHTDTWRRRRRESLTEVPAEKPVTDAEPEDTRALHRMLATLAPRERQAVVLRHYVGLSEAETAQTLGCSVGTVKSSCSRGLARLREQTAKRGPAVRSDFIDESDLEAIFHSASVPDMSVGVDAVIGRARRTRARRRGAAVSGTSALALVVGGVWLGLPGGRDRASTDPAAPTRTTRTLLTPVSASVQVPDVEADGRQAPGVTYDVRLDPGAGAGGADRVSVSGGGRGAEVDVRPAELVGTAGVTRRVGPRDFVVVTDSAVRSIDVRLAADAEDAGATTSAGAGFGRSGLRLFAVRFDHIVPDDEVLGTLAFDGSSEQMISVMADGRAGRTMSATIPGGHGILYADEALDVIGVRGEGGASVPLSTVDERVALLWGSTGKTGAAGLFPQGSRVSSASVTWDAPGRSPGSATAEVITLEPGGRTGWYATIPSSRARTDLRSVTITWTDQHGRHTAMP